MKIRKTKEQPIKYNAEISIELRHKNATFWWNLTQLAGIQPCQNVPAAWNFAAFSNLFILILFKQIPKR